MRYKRGTLFNKSQFEMEITLIKGFCEIYVADTSFLSSSTVSPEPKVDGETALIGSLLGVLAAYQQPQPRGCSRLLPP